MCTELILLVPHVNIVQEVLLWKLGENSKSGGFVY
jgi:hypothetical protein